MLMAGSRILLRESAYRLAVVGDESLFDNIPVFIQYADGVLLVSEVESDGDGWNFVFHGAASVSRRSSAACCLLI